MESRKQRYRQQKSEKHGIRRLLGTVLNFGAIISLPAVVIVSVLILLPVSWLALPVPRLPADTMIYDQKGHLVSALKGSENRIPVSYSAIPPIMQNALVSIEDNTYWIRPAIDPVGIMRAALVNVLHRKILQGGSTITQQLAKNLYLNENRTISRKLKELLITLKLSTMFDKRQILTMYLNDVYFGEGAYGIEAASEIYFGHSLRQLTLPEAALLAGLVNAPTDFDPYFHPHRAMMRRNLVLQRMADLQYITPKEAQLAERVPLHLSRAASMTNQAPYFIKFVANELLRLDPSIGDKFVNGGLKVTTTMNWGMQKDAEKTIVQYLPKTHDVHGVPEPEAALIAINPQNGYIEALVGGDNFAKTSFDRATKAARPPGSVMKYFLYTTVIRDDFPTSSIKDSSPVRFSAGSGRWYIPHNFGDVYHGPLTIRRAIAYSDNIVAVKWIKTIGPLTMIDMAHKMGITSPLEDNLTTALGSSSVTPQEMAAGVLPLANGGKHIKPLGILKVANSNGQTIFRVTTHKKRVISPQIAYVVTNLFRAPLLNPQGTAHNLQSIINRPVAAKTGTSSQQRDAWLVGYTPQLATAVWVGNDNDSPLGLTGDLGAGPIWAHFMHRALASTPKKDFVPPSGILWKSVCEKTGLLANPCCSSYREVFVEGHAPIKVSPGCHKRKDHRKNARNSSRVVPHSRRPKRIAGRSLIKSILKSLTP